MLGADLIPDFEKRGQWSCQSYLRGLEFLLLEENATFILSARVDCTIIIAKKNLNYTK